LAIGAVRLGWQAPYLGLTAALFAALDGWFLSVMVRLIRQEGRAKRLFEEGRALRGRVVRFAGFDRPVPPSSWEGTGSCLYAVALEYSFRTPEGREVVRKESRFAEDLKGQPLPVPGTPVLVMYLDDEHYEVL
jgi:hypothetical protein